MSTFETAQDIPVWRKLALSTWRRSDDPTICGWLDIDATELIAFVEERRRTTGIRVSLTHVVGKAVGLALARVPQCNAVVSWGRLRRRDSVDVFFSVVGEEGRELSGTKIEGIDRLSVEEVALRLRRSARRIRQRKDASLQRSQNRLARLPGVLLGPVMRATHFASFDLGMDLSRLGVPSDPLGSAIVTNIGVFGIEQGFAPLVPQGGNAVIFCVGKVTERAIAVDGRPTVRPILRISGTFDHRIVDGSHSGQAQPKVASRFGGASQILVAAHFSRRRLRAANRVEPADAVQLVPR